MTGAEVYGDCLRWCMCAKHGKLKTRLIRTINPVIATHQNPKFLGWFQERFLHHTDSRKISFRARIHP